MDRVLESETEIVYKIDSPRLLNLALVNSLIEPNKKLRFEWNETLIRTDLFVPFLGQYFVQVGLTCDNSRLSSHAEPTKTPHHIKQASDDKEAQRLVAQTFEEGFVKVWSQSISPQVIQDFSTALTNVTTAQDSAFVEIDGQPVGVVVKTPLPIYTGEVLDHVAWIWVKKQVHRRTRAQTLSDLTLWLKDHTSGRIAAGTYGGHTRSIHLCQRSGFQTICATFSALSSY